MSGPDRVWLVLATFYTSLSGFWDAMAGDTVFAALATTEAVACWWALTLIADE